MQVRTAQPIATRDKPAADRRAVFVSIDNESATLDLLIAQQNDKFGQLRCIYIDTSAQDSSGDGCTIETDIGQKITALANTQGYYPVFVPFVTKLTISSNQAVTLLMLDFDMRPVTWPTVLQSESVPDPLHVIIDDQPIRTNATVQNWPASQPVTIDGQPIATNATLQNWLTDFPVSQNSAWIVTAAQSGAWNVAVDNFPSIQPVSISGQPIATTGEGLGLGFAFVTSNGSFPAAIGPNAIPVNAITSVNIFAIGYTDTAGPQISFQLGALGTPGRIALPYSASAINASLLTMNGLNLNVGSVQSSVTVLVTGSGTMTGSILVAFAYR